MTAQILDCLINESDVDLKGQQVLWVCRPDDSSNDWSFFPVTPEFSFNDRMRMIVGEVAAWDCLRGYVATFRLHADDRLELVQYEFRYADEGTPLQICNAFFEGDFQVALCPFFWGPKTVIPFRDGKIVRDRNQWEIEDQILTGVVSRTFQAIGSDETTGWLVNIEGGGIAFAPSEASAPELRPDPEALVGQHVECLLLIVDQVRNNMLVRIERRSDQQQDD